MIINQQQSPIQNSTEGMEGTTRAAQDHGDFGGPKDENTILISSQNQEHKTPRRKSNGHYHYFWLILLTWIRILCMEIPLAVFLGCFAISNGAQYFFDVYYVPYMKSVLYDDSREQEEYTYYHRICSEDDFTAKSLNDLLVSPNATDGTYPAIRHGSAIFPKVVLEDHALEMREHALERNQIISRKDHVEYIPLISNDHRWSYKLDIDDHPSIEKVMQDIAGHAPLVKTLEDILGPDPALVELTAITAAYGAGDQHFHKDNAHEMTQQHMGRTWADMYSIFIPLQDTTAEMGATDACPGFHMCLDFDDLCDENTALRMADDTRIWGAGDAWLFQASTNHRGPAHKDPKGGHRVMLVLTFTARPGTIEDDRRIPSIHTSWSLKMEMSGLSLRDLATPRSEWSWLGKIAAWSGFRQHSFDYVHFSAIRIINDQFQYKTHSLHEHLSRINRMTTGPDDGWVMSKCIWLYKYLFGGQPPAMPKSRNNIFHVDDTIEVYLEKNWEPGVVRQRIDERSYTVQLEHSGDTISAHAYQLCKRSQCSEFLPWRNYIALCLERMRSSSWQAISFVAPFYASVLFLLMIFTRQGQSRAPLFVSSSLRLVLFSAPFWGIAALYLHRIHTSQWGKDVASGHVFDRPYLSPRIPSQWQIPREMGPTIFPYEMDVLITTRFDSPGFGKRNHHFDMTHPGNSLWNALIRHHVFAYATLPSLFQEAIVTSIHSVLSQNFGTILLQNHAGNWIYLSDNEARIITRKKLHEENCFKTALLMQIVRELCSELKFGRKRKSALYRLHTPAFIHRLEAAIYGNIEATPKIRQSSPSYFRSKSVHFPLFKMLLHPLLPSRTVQSVPRTSTYLPQIEGLLRPRLEVGDSALAYTTKTWLMGEIFKVEYTPAKYGGRGDSSMLVYYYVKTRDGKVRRLPENLVRYYGEGIEAEGVVKEESEKGFSRMTQVNATGSVDYEAYTLS